MSRPFAFSDRLRSLGYGLQGLAYLIRTQHNAWIHAIITALVAVAGFCFRLSAAEWCWIVLATVIVWMAEALNTAIELLADATTRDHHPLIGRAKDVAAGAVLLTAIGAVIIGALVFLPHVRALCEARSN